MHLALTRRRALGAGAALLLGARAARAAGPDEMLPLAQVVELTGPASLDGDAWRSGVELAVQEINAAGGLLGRLVQVTTYDAQSTAVGAHIAMQKALETDPLAVLGPALTEASRGALLIPRGRFTPLILGGNAADLTGPAHPGTFRSLPSTSAMMARLCGWLRDDAKATRLAVLWSGHDPFRSDRDALLPEARRHGVDLVAEWVAESGDPATDLPRLLSAAPDLLLLLLPEGLAGHAIVAARRLAPRLPLVGGAPLLARHALEAAGAAAEGVRAHVLIPPEPDAGPIAGFAARYLAADKQPAETLALAGYLAVGMVKAGLAKAGVADPRLLAEALRGLSVTVAEQPMLLADASWNAAGDPDRASWIVELRGGKPRSVQMLRDAP